MAKKVKLNQLSKAIDDILETYSDEVINDTKEVVDEVTKEALRITKAHAPIDDRNVDRKGKYKKSIKKITVYESITEKRNIIHASNGEHRLTHLLELGHATVNGGRTKEHPHFKMGNDYVLQNYEKKLKNKLGGK